MTTRKRFGELSPRLQFAFRNMRISPCAEVYYVDDGECIVTDEPVDLHPRGLQSRGVGWSCNDLVASSSVMNLFRRRHARSVP